MSHEGNDEGALVHKAGPLVALTVSEVERDAATPEGWRGIVHAASDLYFGQLGFRHDAVGRDDYDTYEDDGDA